MIDRWICLGLLESGRGGESFGSSLVGGCWVANKGSVVGQDLFEDAEAFLFVGDEAGRCGKRWRLPCFSLVHVDPGFAFGPEV